MIFNYLKTNTLAPEALASLIGCGHKTNGVRLSDDSFNQMMRVLNRLPHFGIELDIEVLLIDQQTYLAKKEDPAAARDFALIERVMNGIIADNPARAEEEGLHFLIAAPRVFIVVRSVNDDNSVIDIFVGNVRPVK